LSRQYKESLERFRLPEFNLDWGTTLRGIEKESLRVTTQGDIALSSHPLALGSALTNPYITTDFSEALLEFITPVYGNTSECLEMLENIHRFTYQNLENEELLWTSSMPCSMADTEKIPLAQYGDSNIGRLKTLYREGLSHRYGSVMQTVAGIHYNFSMPDSFWQAYKEICDSSESMQQFRTDKYLHLIRNFHRYSWLLLYLFGASPAACKCFVNGRSHNLEEYDEYSLYLPDATCLRMGNLGYSSEAQKSLFVCYNEIETYVECLHQAMHTAYPAYEEIGTKKNGKYLQINANLLQLENEFYSTIRPKRISKSGERPLIALTNDGIEYVEVRALDLNPFLPLGIDTQQIQFLDSFLLYCLLSESPQCNQREFFEVGENIASVVERGRDPNLALSLEGEEVRLTQWATELLNDINHSAVLLDQVHEHNQHTASVSVQMAKVVNPELTPSGQILKIMQDRQLSYYDFAMEQSQAHKAYFMDKALNGETKTLMQETSTHSLTNQQGIEVADKLDFDEFLVQWNAT
jgi:glutamate--cysteine ligase